MSTVDNSDTGPSYDHTDTSQMDSDPITSVLPHHYSLSPAPSHTVVLFDDDHTVDLAYKPVLLKTKNGERLWYVSEDQKCIDFCKN